MRSRLIAFVVPAVIAGGLATSHVTTNVAAAPSGVSGYTAGLPNGNILGAGHGAAQRAGDGGQHRTTTVGQDKPQIPTRAAIVAAKGYMLGLINSERRQAGAAPLTLDRALTLIAQGRSEDMIARHYFAHQIPGGGMVFDILDRQHVPYQMAGENLALNNYIDVMPLTRTVDRTNADLMRSPEHRTNLLQPAYARIGLGMAFDQSNGRMIVTQVFVQP